MFLFPFIFIYLFIYFTESSVLENYKNPLSLEATELQLANVNIILKFLSMIEVFLYFSNQSPFCSTRKCTNIPD